MRLIRSNPTFFTHFRKGKTNIPFEELRFGGGTALAIYHFQHRLSFDLDFFVGDCQYLDFFRPKLWIDDYNCFSSEYTDQAHHIQINTEKVKIDILSTQFFTPPCYDWLEIFPFEMCVESIEDIIAKKIHFRKENNVTRDIFDMAVAIKNDENLFANLLNLGAVTREDFAKLHNALLQLDKTRYFGQVKITKPSSQYDKLASNAPQIIINKLQSII